MNPFLRPDERLQRVAHPEPALLVVTPDGRRFLFPGEEAIARILARHVLGDDVLRAPATRIESGERRDNAFVSERVLKAPPTAPETNTDADSPFVTRR